MATTWMLHNTPPPPIDVSGLHAPAKPRSSPDGTELLANAEISAFQEQQLWLAKMLRDDAPYDGLKTLSVHLKSCGMEWVRAFLQAGAVDAFSRIRIACPAAAVAAAAVAFGEPL